ncbi:Superoxide dismutase (Cu-Zn) 4A [Citrus sinensis]|uniref:Superoxide dismutase (Cu-Zn) 4A n=1 Tax=Citrus sinensis TaxID=2711 RepID=A0ACB8KJF3_CITSI|nr:Superoxide dismutase (Cu-Zn) 4A [Citrus sinensis]
MVKAVAVLSGTEDVKGSQTTVTGSFSGLKPGLHGFHVHALGNTTNDPTLTVLDKNTISLSGPNSIIGRAVVVHSDPDNLGKGGHELSKTTGNAGGRVACGIIGIQG